MPHPRGDGAPVLGPEVHLGPVPFREPQSQRSSGPPWPQPPLPLAQGGATGSPESPGAARPRTHWCPNTGRRQPCRPVGADPVLSRAGWGGVPVTRGTGTGPPSARTPCGRRPCCRRGRCRWPSHSPARRPRSSPACCRLRLCGDRGRAPVGSLGPRWQRPARLLWGRRALGCCKSCCEVRTARRWPVCREGLSLALAVAGGPWHQIRAPHHQALPPGSAHCGEGDTKGQPCPRAC